MEQSWLETMECTGILASHFKKQMIPNTSGVDFSSWDAGIYAVLVILSFAANRTSGQDERDKCKRLICVIFSQLGCDCALNVHAGVVARVEDNDAGPFDFQVKDGVMRPDAQLPSQLRRFVGMTVADAGVNGFLEQQSDVVALAACHCGGPCRTTAAARPCLAERSFAVLECGRRDNEVRQAGSPVFH